MDIHINAVEYGFRASAEMEISDLDQGLWHVLTGVGKARVYQYQDAKTMRPASTPIGNRRSALLCG